MPVIATVKTDGLHLRPEPNMVGRPKDILTKGDQLRVSDDVPRNGNWTYGKVIHTKSGLGVGESGWFFGPDVSLSELKPVQRDTPIVSRPEPMPTHRPTVIEQDARRSQPWWLLVMAALGLALVAWAIFWGF